MFIKKTILNVIFKQYIFLIEANVFNVLKKANIVFSKLLSIKEVLSLSIKSIVR